MDLKKLHPNQPLTIDEFASIMQTSGRTMRKFYKAGKLPPPSAWIGRGPRWTWAEVERFILRGGTGQNAKSDLSGDVRGKK
jgi:hypothetical protein